MTEICRWVYAPAIAATHSNGYYMKDNTPEHGRRPEQTKKRPAERLKQALRENLKRRKSQARERGETAAPSSNRGDAAPHLGGAKKPDE